MTYTRHNERRRPGWKSNVGPVRHSTLNGIRRKLYNLVQDFLSNIEHKESLSMAYTQHGKMLPVVYPKAVF